MKIDPSSASNFDPPMWGLTAYIPIGYASYIKGQKHTLLSNRENHTLDRSKALKKLLAANKRLNTAYLLKESFGQLWSYQTEGWARRIFDNLEAVAQMAAVEDV